MAFKEQQAQPSDSSEPVSSDRESVIRTCINAIGRESFPDDTNVTWKIREIVHKGLYSFVEAEPTPPSVGYPKFKFVLMFSTKQPTVVGCYCFDKEWSLLFTAPDTPSDWQTL